VLFGDPDWTVVLRDAGLLAGLALIASWGAVAAFRAYQSAA
jgi:hypothetical protein